MNRAIPQHHPRITGLGAAVPEGRIDSAQFAELNARICNATPRQQKILQRLSRQSRIEQRHSVAIETNGAANHHGGAHDHETHNGNGESFHPSTPATLSGEAGAFPAFPLYLPNGASRRPATAERMAFYDAAAPGLAQRAACQALTFPESITHLVTVSCTGFAAPGWELTLIGWLGLPADVQRAHLGFMGCHGAINGLRVAAAFAAQPGARVLLVALELCTLHYQDDLTRDSLLPNTLFGDGAAALVLENGALNGNSNGNGHAPQYSGLRFIGSASQILPDSRGQMTWRITDSGFRMTLDAQVPRTIARHLAPAVDGLLARHGLGRPDVAGWVIHPGGPRILESALEALGLDPAHGESARRTLARYGNMSSPTVLFILRDLLERAAPAGPIVLMAFGPGLVAELALLGNG